MLEEGSLGGATTGSTRPLTCVSILVIPTFAFDFDSFESLGLQLNVQCFRFGSHEQYCSLPVTSDVASLGGKKKMVYTWLHEEAKNGI